MLRKKAVTAPLSPRALATSPTTARYSVARSRARGLVSSASGRGVTGTISVSPRGVAAPTSARSRASIEMPRLPSGSITWLVICTTQPMDENSPAIWGTATSRPSWCSSA